MKVETDQESPEKSSMGLEEIEEKIKKGIGKAKGHKLSWLHRWRKTNLSAGKKCSTTDDLCDSCWSVDTGDADAYCQRAKRKERNFWIGFVPKNQSHLSNDTSRVEWGS